MSLSFGAKNDGEGGNMETKYRRIAAIFLLLGMMWAWTPVNGADWYVDPGADPHGDGTSWSQAFQTIQQAVNAAEDRWMICSGPPDTIHVMGGIYPRLTPIEIDKYVTVLGGYNFKGIRDWRNNPTIIDGLDIARRCLTITRRAIIDGFTIRNARSNGIEIDSSPVYCSTFDFYHVPIIRNCIFEDNGPNSLTFDPPNDGGGIYDNHSSSRIENCIFQRNIANQGGGIYFRGSRNIFDRCVFRDNQVFESGGAIHEQTADLTTDESATITNCLFYNNHSETVAGAIAFYRVPPRIRNSTFVGNTTIIGGGAFYGRYGPNVYNSIFWDNLPDQLVALYDHPDHYVAHSCMQDGWTGPGTDNTDDDPTFVAPTTHDYHLALGSPGIDTGYRDGMPLEDLDGVLRPHDGTGDGIAKWDMGAYEFLLVTLPGDFDWDWDVDGRNLPVFGNSFGTDIGDLAYNASCDFDKNGSVDENDLSVFAEKFGQIGSP
jgi:hypothetical protein